MSSGVLQGKTDDGRASLRYPAMQVGHSLHMGLDVDGHGHFLLHYITVDKTSALSRYDFTSTGHVFRIDPFTAKDTCWATLNGFTAAWGNYVATQSDRPYPHVRVYKVVRTYDRQASE